MPVTLTKPKQTEPVSGDGGDGFDDLNRFGGDGNDNAPGRERTPPPEGYRLAMRLTLVWVTVLFVTLVVMYVYLDAQKAALVTPRLFWFSTGVMLCCSASLEVARRALRLRQEALFQRWLWLTMGLGLVFLLAQYLGLRQLAAAGFFANVNKRAWLAFLITGSHAAHLLGGLLALVYLLVKNKFGDWTALRRRVTMDTTVLYWHFIDGLWLFLFWLLFFWN